MAARRRLLARVTATASLVGLLSCGAERALNEGDHFGTYALAQVDGHDLGWYHQLNAVDCAAAFTSGELVIGPGNYFLLRLSYDFRCLGADPFDGSDGFGVLGSSIIALPDKLTLNGTGPDLIGGPASLDRWTLNVVPLAGDRIELRFAGSEGEYWGDPVLIMGPKVPHPDP